MEEFRLGEAGRPLVTVSKVNENKRREERCEITTQLKHKY
jgi:hypothetical protein